MKDEGLGMKDADGDAKPAGEPTRCAEETMNQFPKPINHGRLPTAHYFPDLAVAAFSIFAQVSRSVTVRLKTSRSDVESGSTQKYPNRSNW